MPFIPLSKHEPSLAGASAVAVGVLTVFLGCSDDEKVPCPPSLPALGTETLAGCQGRCADGEVCSRGECTPVGPRKTCGPLRFGTDLTGTNVWYVDGSYDGKNGASDGTMERPHTRIRDALDEIILGGAVLVADGVYDEELVIRKNVELRCRCPDRVTLVGPIRIDASWTVYEKRVVYIEGCRIVPRHLAAGGVAQNWPSCDAQGEPAGIFAHAREADNGPLIMRVQDSLLEGFCRGIVYEGHPNTGSNLCVSAVKVSRNVVGIDLLAAPSHSECRDVPGGLVVVQSHLHENRDQGLLVRRHGESVALYGNLVERTGQLGETQQGDGNAVQVGAVKWTKMVDNLVRNNKGFGIAVVNDTEHHSEPGGVHDPDLIHFEHNTLVGNAGVGIAVESVGADLPLRVHDNLVLRTASLGGQGGNGISLVGQPSKALSIDMEANIVQAAAGAAVSLQYVGGRFDLNRLGDSHHGLAMQSVALEEGNNAQCRNVASAPGKVSSLSLPAIVD